MQRILPRVLLFLLLGALLNVIVAWRIAVMNPTTTWLKWSPMMSFVLADQIWRERMDPTGLSAQDFDAHRNRGNGFESIVVRNYNPYRSFVSSDEREDRAIEIVRAGWPLVSLEGELRTRVRSEMSRTNRSSLLFEDGAKRRILPFRPIWWPFILNSMLYAVGTFLLALPLKLGTQKSPTRGKLCPQCKYDLRSKDGEPPWTCSECGFVIESPAMFHPRPLAQAWTFILVLPLPIGFLLWFAGSISWRQVEVSWLYYSPWVWPVAAVCALLVAVETLRIARLAYSDRPARRRIVLSVAVACLGVVSWLTALMVIVERMSW